MARGWTILLFIVLPLLLSAQTKDTTKLERSQVIRYTTPGEAFHLHSLDTSLHDRDIYNPVERSLDLPDGGEVLPLYAHLGNLGSPYHPLTLRLPDQVEFDPGLPDYGKYVRTPGETRYFRTPTPFTEAQYVLGIKGEQKFGILHTQNVTARLNFGVSYDRIHSKGFYRNQKADHQNIQLWSWWQSPNQRYNLMVNGLFNKSVVQENGGLRLEPDTTPERLSQNLSVNLQTPERRGEQMQGFLQQSWDWGTYRTKQVDTLTYEEFYPSQRVSHRFYYQNRYFSYREDSADMGIYDDIFVDSFRDVNSHYFTRISNRLSWSMLPLREMRDSVPVFHDHQFTAGVEHNLLLLTDRNRQYEYQTSGRQNLTGFAEWKKPAYESDWGFHGRGEVGFLDRNRGDYYAEAGTYWAPRKTLDTVDDYSPRLRTPYKVGATVIHQQFAPSWQASTYYGNHDRWSNDFSKTIATSLQVYGRSLPWNLRLTVNGHLVHNYIYYDESAQPVQVGAPVSVGVVQLSKNFSFGSWRFDNLVTYQQVQGPAVIHLPRFWSKHRLYYDGWLFSHALLSNIGVEVDYRGPYAGYRYRPSTGHFYLNEGGPLLHPPVVDVFANFRVKSFQFFAKLSYVNFLYRKYQHFFDSRFVDAAYQRGLYFDVTPYALPGFSIRGGFRWRLYD